MPKQTFFNLPAEKRQMIVDILLDDFCENNFKSVSISRIVERAGIAKGSFYQYFEDKADCYFYLLQLAGEEKMAFIRQVSPPASDVDIFATLRHLLKAGLSFEFSNPRLAKIGYRAVFGDAPLPEETMAFIRQVELTYFRQMVTQSIADGYLRDDIDPDVAAFAFSTLFTNLWSYLLERFDVEPTRLLTEGGKVLDDDAIHAAIDQVLTILEKGLRI